MRSRLEASQKKAKTAWISRGRRMTALRTCVLLSVFSTSILKSKRAFTRVLRCLLKRPVHHPECFETLSLEPRPHDRQQYPAIRLFLNETDVASPKVSSMKRCSPSSSPDTSRLPSHLISCSIPKPRIFGQRTIGNPQGRRAKTLKRFPTINFAFDAV